MGGGRYSVRAAGFGSLGSLTTAGDPFVPPFKPAVFSGTVNDTLVTVASFDSIGGSVHGRNAVAAIAWQAGAGVFWNKSDRMALVLGE